MTETRDTAPILRILDANLNRASEGLRVAEEFARFAFGDEFLSRTLKETRHELGKAIQHLGGEKKRLVHRDTLGDVGTEIAVVSEMNRQTSSDVAHAALKRAQQALRSLEEYGKTISGEFAEVCERLRYKTYTIEKALLGVRDPGSSLATARVYVLIDGKQDLESFETAARQIASEADVIQLRDKQLPDAPLLARAKRLRAITRETDCLFIMNDRPDLAVLAEADGVHVGQEELGVAEVRRIVGVQAIIGVSTHSIAQLQRAILDGASYVGCGPVFSSKTKTFEQFAGLEYLRQAAAETSLPSFAIGGIDLANLNQVIEAGFHRVAIQSAVSHPKMSPAEVIRAMKTKLAVQGD